ncbi:MAG: nucleotidyltransferase family protein [Candidatus Omnitrophica bacterium]|nr:nucleotidyltransferase family protein [Candidatus Omnitrophota bacterium]
MKKNVFNFDSSDLSDNKKDICAILGSGNIKLTSFLNWPEMLRVARHSSVSPSLYLAAKHNEKKFCVPDEIYKELKLDYTICSFLNQIKLEDFERVSFEFKKTNISFILLKGIHLLNTAFSFDSGARAIGDIDILVKKDDLVSASRIITVLGYKYFESLTNARPTRMFIKKSETGIELAVHLHTHIVNLSEKFMDKDLTSINLDDIFSSANVAAPLFGKDAGLLMKNEHMLISLCEHGFRHGFARLGLLYDIHKFIGYAGNNLDWQEVKRVSVSWSIKVPVCQGLYLSRLFFGTNIEADFLSQLCPKGFSLLEQYLLGRVAKQDYLKEYEYPFLYFLQKKPLFSKTRFLKTCFSNKFRI